MSGPASLLERLADSGGYAVDLTLTEGLEPGALLDGVRATPHRWASLLCERLEGSPE